MWRSRWNSLRLFTSARYDSLIAVPATISKVPTKAHLPAV